MGSFSIWHWLIVLLVVVLLFGTKRLKNIGSDLGGAVKGFRESVRSAEAEAPAPAAKLPHDGAALVQQANQQDQQRQPS